MKIVVKNSQLGKDTMSCISSLVSMDINASAAFKLTRILKELSSIVSDKIIFEKKILDKWVVKDDNGKAVLPKNEDGTEISGAISVTDMDGFTKEMREFMETENEIPFDKIDFDSLGLSTAKISDLMKIEFLFI
jgi:hypothetical protein